MKTDNTTPMEDKHTHFTEEELKQQPLDIDKILVDIDKRLAEMNKQSGYSNAIFDVIDLMEDELTIDQIIKILKLKPKL